MKSFRLTNPKLTENDVEVACLDLLRVRGWYVLRIHSGTFKTLDGKRWIKGAPKGTPDYLCVHAEYRGFFLETKRPGRDLDPDQQFVRLGIEQRYRISVCKADSARALVEFLDRQERKV